MTQAGPTLYPRASILPALILLDLQAQRLGLRMLGVSLKNAIKRGPGCFALA